MQHFALKGEPRQVGNKATVKAFRAQGLVPCNLYGAGVENVLFTVSEKDLQGLTNTPASFIVDLTVGDKTYTAIAHELQYHPVKDNCLHADFLAVSEDKPVTIQIPLVISGHAKGVQMGGKFVQNSRSLKVCGLMANLPDTLPVDVTNLELGKRIKAGELKFEGLNIVTDKDTIVCTVKATRNSGK